MGEYKKILVLFEASDIYYLKNKGYSISKLTRKLTANFVTEEKKKEELLYAVQQQPEYPKG